MWLSQPIGRSLGDSCFEFEAAPKTRLRILPRLTQPHDSANILGEKSCFEFEADAQPEIIAV